MSEPRANPNDAPRPAGRAVPAATLEDAVIGRQRRHDRRQRGGPCWAVVLGVDRAAAVPSDDRHTTRGERK